MGAVITTIFNFGVTIFSWFGRVGLWLTGFSKVLNMQNLLQFLSFAFSKKFVLIAVALNLIIFLAYITALITVINQIYSLFDMVNSLASSSGTVGSTDTGFSMFCFFHFLELLGILDALRATLPLFGAFMSFYFARLFYVNAWKHFSDIADRISRGKYL